MRKRHAEPKSRTGKIRPAPSRSKPVDPKRTKRSSRTIDECRTYVTEVALQNLIAVVSKMKVTARSRLFSLPLRPISLLVFS
jgi:hypothetical protein